MIDIETLDTKSSAVVIQIAAVVFNYTDKGKIEIVDELDIKLPVAPQLVSTRTISLDTIKFWLNSGEQQQLLGELLSNPVKYNYSHALVEFVEFCIDHKPSEFWSQGPTFDSIILEDMLSNEGLVTPWKFYQVRDLRTVQEFVGHDDKSRAMKKANSNHNALDDCHSQIKLLQYFIKKANK